ncbi:MAG: methyltransferase domain-containing protein, partial [Steroidobacteraceae bacterium]|nr:methyltransferase domain-containing protein [Steroidobacteraceae bacterium]
MEPQFWLERWQKHEIGFHQSAPHPALARFWSRLALRPGARVFVPLAGKSLDMLWLAQAGFQVVGIELSPIAVAQFAAEHAPEARRNVELRCGDFFALTRAALGPVDAVFDRAALVALPAAQRRDYVAQMTWLTGSGC